MTLAQSYLILAGQDDKMLSCKRWFISIMIFNFNIFIILLFAFGFFGCFSEQNQTVAMEAAAKIQINEEIEKQNELIDWLDLMSVKYYGYKMSFPVEGMVHAKGTVPVGKSSVRVNVLEINKNINQSLEIKPEIASNYLNSRVKIRTIANRTGAIAAINGGYFKPQTGVPLGALVINNEILTGPIYNRAAIGINSDGTYSIGKTNIKFFLQNKKMNLKIDNINQPRMLSTYALIYTGRWGKNSPPPPKYGSNAVIENGMITGVYKGSVLIPNGGYVLSAPDDVIKKIKGQKNLVFKIEYPEAFQNSEHIISGGPFLLKDGEIYIDTNEEKLNSINGRNPRTLIGYTENNSLVLVTVDGREKYSVGMSLLEAAKYMKKLGCINAINLDGGSSSVMYLNGKITNTPPTEGGIPISGALVVGLNQITVSNNVETNKM